MMAPLAIDLDAGLRFVDQCVPRSRQSDETSSRSDWRPGSSPTSSPPEQWAANVAAMRNVGVSHFGIANRILPASVADQIALITRVADATLWASGGDGMKITNVSMVVHERKLPTGMPLPPMEMSVLRIHTDEGIEGNTFISPPGPDVTDQIIKQVKPLLLGRDPLDIGAIWHDLWGKRRRCTLRAQGYIDVALWDIAGKAAGLPMHRCSAHVATTVAVYFSSWVHPDAAMLCRRRRRSTGASKGGRAYKLHLPTAACAARGGRARSQDDIEACSWCARRSASDDDG